MQVAHSHAMPLRIFAITKPGLVALTVAVAMLWTCVGLETATRRQADRDTAASIQTLARLRRFTQSPNLTTPVRETLRPFRVQHPFAS